MKKYTVDELLKMGVVERAAVTKQLGCEEKRVLFCSVITLTEILGLDKIESYEERVRLRHEHILKHPNQEHWDYGEYLTKRNKHKRITSKVSTYGNSIAITNVLSVRANADRGYYKNNEFTPYYKSDDKEDPYKGISGYRLNRVITCTFLPLPDHLNHRTIGELHSNHIDGDTLNNHINNLNWTTHGGNIRHGKGHEDYQDCDYILCLFSDDSMFSDMSFIIHRNDPDLDPMVLNTIASNATSRGTYRGYSPTYIKKADTIGKPIGYPKDLLIWWEQHPEWFNPGVIPIIFTATAGPLKGRQFGFIGDKDGKRYFHNPGYAHNVIQAGKDMVYEFHIRKATVKEVLTIENPLSPEEVKQYVKNYVRKATPLVCIGTAVTGRLKGKKYGINGKTGLKDSELPGGNIRKILDKPDYIAYGCIWLSATPKEIQKSSEKITLEELNELKSLGRIIGPYKLIVNKGPFCGHVFYITCQKENIGNFKIQKLVNAVNLGYNYMNCTIVKVDWEDVPPYPYNVLTEEVLKTLI